MIMNQTNTITSHRNLCNLFMSHHNLFMSHHNLFMSHHNLCNL